MGRFFPIAFPSDQNRVWHVNCLVINNKLNMMFILVQEDAMKLVFSIICLMITFIGCASSQQQNQQMEVNNYNDTQENEYYYQEDNGSNSDYANEYNEGVNYAESEYENNYSDSNDYSNENSTNNGYGGNYASNNGYGGNYGYSNTTSESGNYSLNSGITTDTAVNNYQPFGQYNTGNYTATTSYPDNAVATPVNYTEPTNSYTTEATSPGIIDTNARVRFVQVDYADIVDPASSQSIGQLEKGDHPLVTDSSDPQYFKTSANTYIRREHLSDQPVPRNKTSNSWN